MLRLTLQTGAEAGKVHEISSERVTIGRSVNNDLQIIDRRMSRNHSEVFLEGGQWKVRDMGSKNGTLVNGAPCSVAVAVNVGDVIQVGDTEVLFHDESLESSVDKTPTPGGRSARKKEASSWKLVEEHQWGATRGELRAGVPGKALLAMPDAEAGAREMARRLEILYQVTEAIRSTFSLDDLLEEIVQIICEVIKPDRAYLLFRDQESGELTPEVIKTRKEEDDEKEVKISRSIIERCTKEGVSLLVSDAAQDDRFAESESVIMNRIRTAMVAPLIYKGETMGVVYIDTNTRMVPFTQGDLELLTGITNQAALAISNARLHSQLVEQHKLAREMEIARTIQMNLLPKVYPEIEGFQVSAMSLPAKHVGGDYYDFLEMPDGRTVLAIADVSGKGVPAAILTATTRSYLQSETQHSSASVVDTVARINEMVFRDVTNEMYVTMAYVCLDHRTGEIEYVNAGHCYPIIVRSSGEFAFLDKGGLFLGVVPKTEYESERVAIYQGEVLVLATDGVTDIQNRRGEQFGTERLHSVLRKSAHLGAEAIRNAIYQECVKHRGDADQFDDFTLIVVKRDGASDHLLEDLELD